MICKGRNSKKIKPMFQFIAFTVFGDRGISISTAQSIGIVLVLKSGIIASPLINYINIY